MYDQLRDRGRSIKQIAFMSAGFQAVLVGLVYVADQLIGELAGLAFLVVVTGAALALARYLGFLKAG